MSAAAATAVCNGVVAIPCPKEMVTELIFFHVLGWVGVATPGISVSMRDSSPSFVRNCWWPSTPTMSATAAVPMLEEY